MSEVAKGFRQRRFFDLADRDKRDILKLMARVAEQAYRRGVQQGAGLAGKPLFRGELMELARRRRVLIGPWNRLLSPLVMTQPHSKARSLAYNPKDNFILFLCRF